MRAGASVPLTMGFRWLERTGSKYVVLESHDLDARVGKTMAWHPRQKKTWSSQYCSAEGAGISNMVQ